MVEVLVMYKATIEASSEFGVMFLHDSVDGPKLAMNLSEAPIVSDGRSLMFRVQIYVDGESVISVSEMKSEICDDKYFEFSMHCSSKILSMSDHSGFVYLNIPVRKNSVVGKMRFDDSKYPNKVDIFISDIYYF